MEFTLHDLNKLTVLQALEHDKRSFCQYFWDHMKMSHLVINIFVKKNSVPIIIRIVSLLFFISFQFALNAIFFTDSYIAQKNDFSYLKSTGFSFTIQYQLGKSIWSVLIGSIPIIIFKPILKVPAKYYEDYNKDILNNDIPKALEAYNNYLTKMWLRYVAYIIIAILFHLISWYFVTVFCGVYISSSMNWFYGGIITMIIKFIISTPIMSLTRTTIRYLAQTHEDQ